MFLSQVLRGGEGNYASSKPSSGLPGSGRNVRPRGCVGKDPWQAAYEQNSGGRTTESECGEMGSAFPAGNKILAVEQWRERVGTDRTGLAKASAVPRLGAGPGCQRDGSGNAARTARTEGLTKPQCQH